MSRVHDAVILFLCCNEEKFMLTEGIVVTMFHLKKF